MGPILMASLNRTLSGLLPDKGSYLYSNSLMLLLASHVASVHSCDDHGLEWPGAAETLSAHGASWDCFSSRLDVASAIGSPGYGALCYY